MQTRILLGAILLLGACTKDKPALETTRAQDPGVAPAPVTAHAPTPDNAAPITADDVSGTVTETMSSGGYTYAKLERGGSQVWVAGPETPLAVGAKLARTSGSLMTAFHSDTLNRTFDQIYFVGSLAVVGGDVPATPHGAAAAATATAVTKLDPPKDGKSIAEIFASQKALSGKPVALRGKVVKVNNGILDRNWLHVQDGSGQPGTNDLVVTTSADVAKDAIVTIHGVVATNKDFGAGYSYPVLIENATITKE
jgi:hypothetical protein